MTRLLLLAVCVSLAQGATRYTDLKNLQNIQFKPDLDDEIRLKQIENCPTLVTPEIRAEIESHREIAADIIRYAEGTFSGRTYQELHDFLDKHPVRLSGEQNLEDSIDYAIDRMTNEHGFANGKKFHFLSVLKRLIAYFNCSPWRASVGATLGSVRN